MSTSTNLLTAGDRAWKSPDRVIAQEEGEYSTAQLVLVDGELYRGVDNGGARGAWNRQDGDGVWRERPVEPFEPISRTAAVSLLLNWGHSPEEIAALLDDA